MVYKVTIRNLFYITKDERSSGYIDKRHERSFNKNNFYLSKKNILSYG